jgi:hypothetical protein
MMSCLYNSLFSCFRGALAGRQLHDVEEAPATHATRDEFYPLNPPPELQAALDRQRMAHVELLGDGLQEWNWSNPTVVAFKVHDFMTIFLARATAPKEIRDRAIVKVNVQLNSHNLHLEYGAVWMRVQDRTPENKMAALVLLKERYFVFTESSVQALVNFQQDGYVQRLLRHEACGTLYSLGKVVYEGPRMQCCPMGSVVSFIDSRPRRGMAAPLAMTVSTSDRGNECLKCPDVLVHAAGKPKTVFIQEGDLEEEQSEIVMERQTTTDLRAAGGKTGRKLLVQLTKINEAVAEAAPRGGRALRQMRAISQGGVEMGQIRDYFDAQAPQAVVAPKRYPLAIPEVLDHRLSALQPAMGVQLAVDGKRRADWEEDKVFFIAAKVHEIMMIFWKRPASPSRVKERQIAFIALHVESLNAHYDLIWLPKAILIQGLFFEFTPHAVPINQERLGQIIQGLEANQTSSQETCRFKLRVVTTSAGNEFVQLPEEEQQQELMIVAAEGRSMRGPVPRSIARPKIIGVYDDRDIVMGDGL